MLSMIAWWENQAVPLIGMLSLLMVQPEIYLSMLISYLYTFSYKKIGTESYAHYRWKAVKLPITLDISKVESAILNNLLPKKRILAAINQKTIPIKQEARIVLADPHNRYVIACQCQLWRIGCHCVLMVQAHV